MSDDESKLQHEGAGEAGEDGGAGGEGGNTAIKILCANRAVGQVIGKAGATISSIKEQSGANIKVSNSGETYPGTVDRIIMISGAVNAVLSAAHLIIAELQAHHQEHSEADEMTLALAIPSAACGLVIGKGGERINVLREQCECRMQMQSKDQAVRGVQERTFSITGSPENVQQAVEKVVLLLSEDGTVHYDNPSTNYGSAAKMFHPGNSMAAMGVIPGMIDGGILGEVTSIPVTIRLGIPENTVGTLVGKGGATIKEMIAVCGCQIKVSQKGELVPGTELRIVTITGNTVTAACAQALVMQRVPEAQQIP